MCFSASVDRESSIIATGCRMVANSMIVVHDDQNNKNKQNGDVCTRLKDFYHQKGVFYV
jgi:hypothetical protein